MALQKERDNLSIEQLRELLSYDPETGIFHWAKKNGKIYRYGKIAGTKNSQGYCQIMIDLIIYRAHRIAWAYVTGEWPQHEIDHINGDRLDNRFVNLRKATRWQNAVNQGQRKNNTSGYKGVTWHSQAKKWAARIMVNRKSIRLGLFDDPKEAYAAYCTAAIFYFGEFARV